MSPLVIAHRGASAEQPENTRAAFLRAIALQADGIELDVQTTRDGVAVVFHDDRLQRLTATRGRVTERRWEELAGLRVHGREPIPRLAPVLRLTRGRVPVQIELKAGANVTAVVAAIGAARAAAWVILASFSPALLRDAQRLAPRIPRMLITEGRVRPEKIRAQLARLGAVGVSVNCRAVRSAAWVAGFHAADLRVWCWTVNDARVARRLAAWGVDGLVGDDPALLRGAI